MNKILSPNLTRLVGTLNLDREAFDTLDKQCREMKALGYVGVYFNNIFFTVEKTDCGCAEEDILFREDRCLIVRRPEKELRQAKEIIHGNGLDIPSAHFLNMLPESGMPVEAIFETHEKILDMAETIGVRRVTTHIGGIAVPQAARARQRPTPAEQLESKEITYGEYAERVRQAYGEENVVPDSVTVYRHLCAEAAKRGITPTIETACTELYEINTKPEALINFIHAVGASNLGICVDAGHCHLKHLDTADIIRRCGRFFMETHFHDNFADSDRHNPVGIGTLNWLEVIKAMQDAGYQGEITFEQGDYVTNHSNWLLFVAQVEKDRKK